MQNLHLVNARERASPDEDGLTCVTIVPPGAARKWIKSESLPENSVLYHSDYWGGYAFVAGDSLCSTSGETANLGRVPDFWTLSPGGDLALLESGGSVFVYDVDGDNSVLLEEGFGKVVAGAFRNDNKFVAVAAAAGVKTFACDGKVEGSCEVEGVVDVAWNPSGTWLAIAAGNKVLFKEKNCCDRQAVEFEEPVISVTWSYHMDILAVHLQSKVVVLQEKNRVFHRKFEISNPAADFGKVIWAQSTLAFCLLNQDGRIFDYAFNKCADSDENGMYVVNGNVLQISEWSRSLIPPPMCHRKHEVDSQISCVVSNNSCVAVFTNTSLVFGSDVLQLPASPVQCACFRGDKLYFAVGDTVYESDGKTISDGKKMDGFVSFITPSYFVLNEIDVCDGNTTRRLDFPAYIVIQNGEDLAILGRNGVLEHNGQVRSRTAHTLLCTERLLSYIDEGVMHHIVYCGKETAREVEPKAELLFFARKIFSVVIQMNRGNIETVAPHVIVEAALSELIAKNEYGDALKISKRYQIVFSRFIRLGQIDLDPMCSQVSDFQLGQFISSLKPLEDEPEMNFVLELMRFILGANVEYNRQEKSVTFADFNSDGPHAQNFAKTFCICCILLESTPSAIAFACSFNSSDKVKETINFLLTLYDANELYDLSLRTYDPRCITTVALITMKEPSTYVDFVEEIKNMENPHLKIATIEENLGNYARAIHEYALCGAEYEERCMYLITQEKLFEDGIDAYRDNVEVKTKVMLARLDYLEKSTKDADVRCAAMTAISLQSSELIDRFMPQIVKSNIWRVAIPHMNDESKQRLCDVLVKEKSYTDAAYIYQHYLNNTKEASELYAKAQDWLRALECGMAPGEMSELAFKILMGECKKNTKEAERLKKRFVETLEKQKEHPENTKKGKNKDKRGIPSIIAQITQLLPTADRTSQYEFVQGLLRENGQSDLADQLRVAFRQMVRAVWPIPHLPENEEMQVPPFLRGIL